MSWSSDCYNQIFSQLLGNGQVSSLSNKLGAELNGRQEQRPVYSHFCGRTNGQTLCILLAYLSAGLSVYRLEARDLQALYCIASGWKLEQEKERASEQAIMEEIVRVCTHNLRESTWSLEADGANERVGKHLVTCSVDG